ncbi:hypothetical protein ING2E5A_2992 [Petrimonas mucosa]|uniref:Uncharacterized protein n=1 Tax=Petrimonas mucosa TaxID=1642646 RepID=A0A1G4GB58_9BACT|nr:hypothetical protein ING2E5A_2992 [Petrimonas mucosa]SFU71418.1 hypothetical protein SAMN05216364_10915 [Porphyromonadaceae bacterium KHP3R9]
MNNWFTSIRQRETRFGYKNIYFFNMNNLLIVNQNIDKLLT